MEGFVISLETGVCTGIYHVMENMAGIKIGAEDRWHLSIDTVRFSGWISLRLGELCMISTEVLCAATSELGNTSSYSPSEEKPYKVLMPASLA